MSGWRNIVVDGNSYTWRCGRRSVVVRRDRQTWFVQRASSVAGVTNDVWDRGQYKRTSDGVISPAHVEQAIRHRLASSV